MPDLSWGDPQAQLWSCKVISWTWGRWPPCFSFWTRSGGDSILGWLEVGTPGHTHSVNWRPRAQGGRACHPRPDAVLLAGGPCLSSRVGWRRALISRSDQRNTWPSDFPSRPRILSPSRHHHHSRYAFSDPRLPSPSLPACQGGLPQPWGRTWHYRRGVSSLIRGWCCLLFWDSGLERPARNISISF